MATNVRALPHRGSEVPVARGPGGSPFIEAPQLAKRDALRAFTNSAEKYSSAVLVFVCCTPPTSTSSATMYSLVSAAGCKRLGESALGRRLEHARAVEVKPKLGIHPALDALRPEPELRNVHRAEHADIVCVEIIRCVLVVELSLGSVKNE